MDWQIGIFEGGGWNAIFWCNHDQPRVVSRFGDDSTEENRQASAKMLAIALHMLQGTPYIYQGEEIGMTDPHFDSIQQYRDVESRNAYDNLVQQGIDESEVLTILGQNHVTILEHLFNGHRRNKQVSLQVRHGLIFLTIQNTLM